MFKELTVSKEFNVNAARAIVEEASKAASQVYIIYDNKRVNAKSIMGVLALAMKMGENALVEAIGDDAEAVLEKLVKLI